MADEKRPIDRLRESAGSMTVGSSDEGPIGSFLVIGDRLLIVKASAVYEVKFADSIDPDRINPKIPNTQQKVLLYGSDSPLLGRTLLTANVLLNESRIPMINRVAGMERTLAASLDLCAMQAALEQLEHDHQSVEASLVGQKLTSGFIMPMSPELIPGAKAFLQRADHFVQALLDVARLFFPTVTHADSLADHVENSGSPEQAIQFFQSIAQSIRFVREARNAMEHPKTDKRIELRDYTLQPDGKVRSPTIQLSHPTLGGEAIAVVTWMHDTIEKLSIIFEMSLVHLCYPRAECGDYPVAVMLLPKDQRSTPHVRYSYALRFGEEWAPLG